MTSSESIPTVTIPLPESGEELHELLQTAYYRGLDVADHTPPVERFRAGYNAGVMDCIERLVECYGISKFHAVHNPPRTPEELEAGAVDGYALHNAQADAYHTVALTMMLNELRADPETAILQFERLYFHLAQRRFGTEDEQTVLFLYEPTGLCEGFIGGYNAGGKGAPDVEPPAGHDESCGCGGNHPVDTLTVKPGTDILTHLQASYDQLQAANAPAMPDFDPSLN